MTKRKAEPQYIFVAGICCVFAIALVLTWIAFFSDPSVVFSRTASSTIAAIKPKPKLDTRAYDMKLLQMSHVATSSAWYTAYLNAEETASTTEPKPLWPVRTAYPKYGALLPFNRIVAYYGNFYSKGMGVLGEYEPDVMLDKLRTEVAAWEAADPSTPVIPAIHYIVVTAQASGGKDGMYRARMPDSQIDKALDLAKQIDGIVFIDFQVGLSTLQKELPIYESYLKLPNVHLGIDPEFSMKTGAKPGTVIGSFDAADINYAAEYLAKLVQENDLPPKILMVHRFTEDMVTNYKQIKPLPEVQIVMDMDGWGSYLRKINTYTHVVAPEPVQFTGFKLFYKNDLKEDPPRLMTPREVLQLTPQPLYIQYQ